MCLNENKIIESKHQHFGYLTLTSCCCQQMLLDVDSGLQLGPPLHVRLPCRLLVCSCGRSRLHCGRLCHCAGQGQSLQCTVGQYRVSTIYYSLLLSKFVFWVLSVDVDRKVWMCLTRIVVTTKTTPPGLLTTLHQNQSLDLAKPSVRSCSPLLGPLPSPPSRRTWRTSLCSPGPWWWPWASSAVSTSPCLPQAGPCSGTSKWRDHYLFSIYPDTRRQHSAKLSMDWSIEWHKKIRLSLPRQTLRSFLLYNDNNLILRRCHNWFSS